MKVLVTGTEGYIGAILAPYLMRASMEVTGLDTAYYRDGWLYSDPSSLAAAPRTIYRDIRQVTAKDLAGQDAVVHLAELSNDPLGENNPALTRRINHEGSLSLARAAREAGIRRFVYASSCSVYGVGSGEFMTEDSAVNPQTAYAECKVKVERDVGAMAGTDFAPVLLRNATAFGGSPRMRFDIVLNNLAGLAWTTRKIAMVSDGTPWRPLVHVLDICRAIHCALIAPEAAIRGQVFNVGDDSQNYRVREIAAIVGESFPGCEVTMGTSSADNRSYRVSFDKIHRELPGFRCEWDARKGAEQLRRIFERIDMSRDTFEFRAYTRLKQLKYLLSTRQIDADFFWSV
ncbi:MAG: SDR family oxidoreductase [Gammaproteobacteria bacterium]|nr:SDR family oxidoreductase [Gammaproteobacteria bacterium]